MHLAITCILVVSRTPPPSSLLCPTHFTNCSASCDTCAPQSGGDLSGHETSGGNPCDFYSSGAPSGGGHESSQGGKESNGAPSGGGARNSGAAMFALSRAQPGLFRVAGLRRNAGGAFKPVGKH
eukprot:1154720-Pelagomonas_calceolata.AAC.2